MIQINPNQLYEKVSEVEALTRNDGQMFYKDSQEEALSRNPRHRPRCEKRCSCNYWCPRYWREISLVTFLKFPRTFPRL